jgi:dienelactone hydrolase
VVALVACFALALVAAPAHAAVAPSLYLGANCDADAGTLGIQPQVPHPGFSYFFCSDGTPAAGGLNPNTGGLSAVTVPAKYGGDGYTGLPPASGASGDPGADATGHIALDVDVTLPSSGGAHPLIVMMHGCCSGNRTNWEATSFDAGGERWHYSNAWFASRGYVVINYTARGFVNGQNGGSTGQTQLDSRSFEINDFQSLACQVKANEANWATVTGQGTFSIDPARVVVTGGSYGGGFSWLAATDPKWTCDADTGAAGTNMSLAAAAPKYGWTDLAYTLVPNGLHSELPGSLPDFNGCSTGPTQANGAACGSPAPVGIPKTSIVSILYATGNALVNDHTTFSPAITESFACLEGPYPLEVSPTCGGTVGTILPEFIRERSAYYQNDFFANIAGDPSYRVPIYNAGTLTDPLFPAYENRRMANRLLATVSDYPIKQYYGDYQHFVQNKAKEWGDLCGGDRHVCAFGDYPGGNVNADPGGLLRTGVTTRLNKFIDNYALPSGGYGAVPANVTPDVTASLQVCPDNAASLNAPVNEPGPAFDAGTFEALAPNNLSAEMPGAQTTISKVPSNSHALNADPVSNFVAHGGACPTETGIAETGVASYRTDPLPRATTMVGATRLSTNFTETPAGAQGFQLDARLYDVFPNGRAVMVDRGPRRITPAELASGAVSFELHGNGWLFPAGHRVRVEIAQDDEPFVRSSSFPSTAILDRAHLDVPIREPSFSIGGGPDKTVPCLRGRTGTRRKDRLTGTPDGDVITGGRGNDKIDGAEGDDCISGQAGADKLKGGLGADTVKGGSGNDRVKARDGEPDTVSCGSGRDRAKVDRIDRVKGCEKVRRPKGKGKGKRKKK